MNLLTRGNTKTIKGEKKGYLTYILHLAPARLSGYQVCPASSPGCRAACLNTAGRGRFTKTQEARIRKTRQFFEHRAEFMRALVKDIEAGIRKAERENLIPVFRLNGTSDIRWENVECEGYPNIFLRFPDVQFYDYTKLSNRRNIPINYDLTFSWSEDNQVSAMVAIARGMNVAVVFDTPKGKDLPKTYLSLPVFDADDSDLRFNDPRGVAGLRAKGDGKNDDSGFVVKTAA